MEIVVANRLGILQQQAHRDWLGVANCQCRPSQARAGCGRRMEALAPVVPPSVRRGGILARNPEPRPTQEGSRCRKEGCPRVVRHKRRCRARIKARTEDAARKPTARSVMGLWTGRGGKRWIDLMGDRAVCAGDRGCRPEGTHDRRHLGLSCQERCGRRSRMIPFRKSRIESPSRRGDERGGRKPTHPAFTL
jgi:hypothetical protein